MSETESRIKEVFTFFENNDTVLGFRKLMDCAIDTQDLDIYKEWAQKLIDLGHAYVDPFTPEEVDAFRKAAQEETRRHKTLGDNMHNESLELMDQFIQEHFQRRGSSSLRNTGTGKGHKSRKGVRNVPATFTLSKRVGAVG